MKGIAIRNSKFEPVGLVHWDQHQPQLSVLIEDERESLRYLVAVESKKPLYRIVRQRDDKTGKVLLAADSIELGSSQFLGRFASRLTFNPLNVRNFVATVEEDIAQVAATQREQNELVSDLFDQPETPTAPLVCCPCGHQYPPFTPKCPICGGKDPLGSYLYAKAQSRRRNLAHLVCKELKADSLYLPFFA
jgi:hypothetical protein